MRCRFGDGYVRSEGRARRQTFVHYCDGCFQAVAVAGGRFMRHPYPRYRIA